MGRLIEAYSKSKTGDAVMMLGKLRPTEALLVESEPRISRISLEDSITDDVSNVPQESARLVAVDMLEYGDIVRILNGGSPPCDGIVSLSLLESCDIFVTLYGH